MRRGRDGNLEQSAFFSKECLITTYLADPVRVSGSDRHEEKCQNHPTMDIQESEFVGTVVQARRFLVNFLREAKNTKGFCQDAVAS